MISKEKKRFMYLSDFLKKGIRCKKSKVLGKINEILYS
jgi:hypothetical protein